MIGWLELAARNLAANLRRSGLAIAAIATASLALILFGNYINAVRAGLQYSTVHGGVGHLQLSGKGGFDAYSETPLQYALDNRQLRAIQARADGLAAVRRVVPRLNFAGLISSGPRTVTFVGQGVDPAMERAAFGSAQTLVSGRPLWRDPRPDVAVLGVDMARRLGVKVGDRVTLVTSTVSGALNAVDLEVAGLAATGTPQSDSIYLQTRLAQAQALLDTDKVSLAAVLLDDHADLAATRKALAAGAPQLEARDWLTLTPIYRQIVDLYENQFRVFGLFIVLVTLFGLGVIILTSVLERTREIGIMRALGISALNVRILFVLEGLLVALAGIAIGTLLAALLGALANNSLHITVPPPPGRTSGYPLRLLWDWTSVLEIWAGVVALGALIAWLMTGRASRLKVVEALAAL